MRRFTFHSVFALLLPLFPVVGAPLSYEKEIQPLLGKYCGDCHADGAKKGGLDLDKFPSLASVQKEPKEWASIHFNIANWTMPPSNKDQPTPQEREKLTQWIDAILNPYDPAKPDPGRVTIRRLNRAEYNNTVRDLLGVDINPANEFPDDDTGYGFDTIGDVLVLPPILMERYLEAAERVLDAAFNAVAPPSDKRYFAPVAITGDGRRQGRDSKRENYMLSGGGTAGNQNHFPATGTYLVRVKAYGDQAGNEPVKIEILAGDKVLSRHEIQAEKYDDADSIKAEVTIPRGSWRLAVRFTNDFYDERAPDGRRDRNLYIRSISVEGPLKISPEDPSQSGPAKKIFEPLRSQGEKPETARAILEKFTNRAFRRAATTGEIDRLMRIFDLAVSKGEKYEDSLVHAMKAVLISPHFIYRMEFQTEAGNPGAIQEITEYALASRLSYFLWSSMPDDELLSLAHRGQLRKNLPAQVARMIASPKSRALAENFGGQWLETRSLGAVSPARGFRFNENLRQAMRQETETFFHYLLKENRSVMEFLTADYSFINKSLARHYGIIGEFGESLVKTPLPENSLRRGILTHGSVLTVTSDPTRTSPVKRGKWIMENILGIPAPPPPPNVPTLEETAEAANQDDATVRQKLEMHRSKPGCVSCHSLIDPLGFGLENFDPVGAFRINDGKQKVDTAGVMTTGQKFSNPVELAKILEKDKADQFKRCLVQKMMTYALGRGLEAYDRPAVEGILKRLANEKGSFHSLILGIAESLPFQKRRGDAAKPSVK